MELGIVNADTLEPTGTTAIEPHAIPKRRSDAIDVIKGLGIFFVVTNHCFARGSRKFLDTAVTDNIWLYGINRAIHFAVPMFLFVSCALLTRSLAKDFDLKRYSASRWRRTVIPYLIASVAYFIGGWGLPWATDDGWANFWVRLVTGKASFHLYFTIVLIQASIAIPFLVLLFRRYRPNWKLAMAVGIVLQVGMFMLQGTYAFWERPGSILLWYMVPLATGLAVGMSKSIEEIRPHVRTLLLITAASGATYVFAAVAHLAPWTASSNVINGTYALFTGTLAVGFWGASANWPGGRMREILRAMGEVSLPLFLIHPAVMFFLGGPKVTGILASTRIPLPVYWGLTLGITYLIARLIMSTRFGRWVLGDPWRQKPVALIAIP